MKLAFLRRHKKGSALLGVLFFTFVMALLSGSMLKYTISERRSNERVRLLMRARNMAENVAVYASEQLTTKLRRLRSPSPIAFMNGTNAIALPPDSVLNTSFSATTDVEVRAGLTGTTPTSGYLYIDPAVAANASNPNVGLQVAICSVPIIAKSTMSHSSVGSITSYAEQDLQIAMIPLFQFAVFYNMDMEFGPGPNMTISGPVHTNGDLIARIQTNFANTLAFTDRVTSAKGFFANTAHKGSTYMADGSADTGPGGTGPLYFQNPAGTQTNIKDSSGVWRDHKYGTTSVTATTLNNFKTFATSAYNGNLRTSVHGVTSLELPAIGGYKEVDDPSTPEDDRKNGRQIIEAPSSSDDTSIKESKISRRSGLYIIVNPDDDQRTGILPDTTAVTMRARSYRCWLNTINNDSTYTLNEVILPGQPSYGPLNAYVNNLPNAYREDTAVGTNQILRIPKGTGDLGNTGYAVGTPTMAAFQDAFFYDMRRATNSMGAPFNRPTYPFAPRPIAKIDFDMTRFKMMVERTLNNATTSTVYYPALPSDSTTWNAFIYNPSATPAAMGLGVGPSSDQFPTQDTVPVIQRATSGGFYPSQVVLNGYTRTGSTGAVGTYAGRFEIYASTNSGVSWGTALYTSAADESTATFTLPTTAGITHFRFVQYLAGAAPASTRLIDEQIIPVVTDGGTSKVVGLTNSFHVLPSLALGATPVTTDAITEMKIYVGADDDTTNYTYAVTSNTNGVSGTFGTGISTNRFSVSGMTGTTTGSATITATNKFDGSTVTATLNLRKQSDIVAAASPTQTGRWLTVNALPGPDPFRMYFAPADPNNALIKSNPSSFAVATTNLINTAANCPWFDGITVYIHSAEAENKTLSSGVPVRIDSGVRLWNGRGSTISLDGAAYPLRTGFSFATNDAAYIVGHFNADGTINSTTTSTGTGGYSGRYPESTSEMLTSVMGDAITILSQPVFTSAGSNVYYQTSGWSDSMSAHRRTDVSSGYTTSWATTNPSSSNTQDGISDSKKPARMPNLSDVTVSPGFASASTRTAKFSPSVTEVSTCLLTGIVPTSTQTSGGVHNFPRLQEDWAGTVALYIRGSMIAMFQSQVATEPWSIRYYQGAIRNWGLHQSLRSANHDLPLEPIVLSAQRMRYRELTAAEYAAQKAVIEALPR